MLTTRQRIIEIIRSREVVSAIDISRAMNTTPANARHHLSILESQGVVEIIGQQRSGKRGRPTQLYRLTHQVSQHNLDGLTSALLRELLNSLPTADQERALEQVAKRLCCTAKLDGMNPTQRLYYTIQRLNQMNYRAHWEAHAEAPRLMLGHCPYRHILPDHPELCQMDTILLSTLLSSSVIQITKLERNMQGLTQCLFMINKIIGENG